MSAPHVFGRDDPADYPTAVEAAGVIELEDCPVELPSASEREALYAELFGALADVKSTGQPDRIRDGQSIRDGRSEPDVPGGA